MIDWLNNWEIGAANTGATKRRNQAGIRSRPVAVGRSLSIRLKTSLSVTKELISVVHVSFG